MRDTIKPEKTDGELLADKTLSENFVFEQLLTRYEKLIYHICYRYFNNTEDATDAVQEAAIKIFKGLKAVKVPESGSLKGWICAVTSNICLDELRKHRIATEPLPDTGAPGTESSAEDSAAARERAREIFAAIDRLSGHHRILIILRDLQGLSYQELSAAVGVAEGTVKSRLSRARTALKEMLSK